MRSAPEGGLLRRISTPAPGIPAAWLRLGGGDGDPPGENQLQPWETIVFRHRLQCPGHGGCQGTWCQGTRVIGLWPIIYPVSQHELPELSEVGAGITRRWLRGWGRVASGEVHCPRMRSRRRRRPAHLALPPSLAHALGSSMQGTGGSARPRAAGDHCLGWGHVVLGTRVHPPLLALPASSATHFRAGKGSSGSRESKSSGLAFPPQAPECSLEPPGGVLLSPRPLAVPAGSTSQPVLLVDLSFPHHPPHPLRFPLPNPSSLALSPRERPHLRSFPQPPGVRSPAPWRGHRIGWTATPTRKRSGPPARRCPKQRALFNLFEVITVLGYLIF